MKDRKYIMPDPHKCYGEIRLSDSVAPTLLRTDYKSPHLVVTIKEK